jgi:Abortive infection alpha
MIASPVVVPPKTPKIQPIPDTKNRLATDLAKNDVLKSDGLYLISHSITLFSLWADSVRLRRSKRLVMGLAKTKKMLEEAGLEADIVPDKVLLPIFEGMSVEDDESLSDMWAALLANAASPDNAGKVRPGFTAILKQMSPDEAQLLKWIHDHHGPGWTPHVGGLNWRDAQIELGFTTKEEAARSRRIDARMFTCLDGLEAQTLIRRDYYLPLDRSSHVEPNKVDLRKVQFNIVLTERGDAFLEASRPPEPKA